MARCSHRIRWSTQIPVITTREFIKHEGDRFSVPAKFVDATWDNNLAKEWHDWLHSLGHSMSKWDPLANAVDWPDKKTVHDLLPDPDIRSVKGGRAEKEFTRELKDKPLLNYPSCIDNYQIRFLGQIWGSVIFAERDLERSAKRFLRDHVHWTPQAFELAGKAVAKLGLSGYSAFHIRRNDLQYKEKFIAAEKTLQHTQALLEPKETLYIATDETSKDFFNAIEEKHHVVRWSDLFAPPLSVFDEGEVPRKLEGVVEQLICAGGRRFFGTESSTFTAWIVRARGYIGVPDTEAYYHTIKYTGDRERDAKLRPRHSPTNLYFEDPAMWEDLKQ